MDGCSGSGEQLGTALQQPSQSMPRVSSLQSLDASTNSFGDNEVAEPAHPPVQFFLKATPPESRTKKRAHVINSNTPSPSTRESPRSPKKKLQKQASPKQYFSKKNNNSFPQASGSQFDYGQCTPEPPREEAMPKFSTPKWDPTATPTRSTLRKTPRTAESTASGRRLSWREISVYYFDRAQGFETVPHEGELALGMQDQHHTERSFKLNSKGQPFIGIDDDTGDLSSGEEEPMAVEKHSARHIHNMSRQQIAKVLKRAGVVVVRSGENELEQLRISRRSAGCGCPDGICLPETCQCARDGIKCQWDGHGQTYGPCSCVDEFCCENPLGRVEYNQEKVAAHHVETRQRWRDYTRTGIYKAPTRIRLDSGEANSTYCDTPPASCSRAEAPVPVPQPLDVVLPTTAPASTPKLPPSPRKTFAKTPLTPTRRQPVRATSLSRLPTPTKPVELDDIPLKQRLRRSNSANALEKMEAEPKTPRMRRSSSLPRVQPSFTSLPPATSIDAASGSALFVKPLMGTPTAPRLPLNRVSSAARLRPQIHTTPSYQQIQAGQVEEINRANIPSPPAVCISPDEDSSRPMPLPRFPVTPVYQRLKPSLLKSAASTVQLQPFLPDNNSQARLTPSRSSACLRPLATIARPFIGSPRGLTPSKSTLQLPRRVLPRTDDENKEMAFDNNWSKGPPSPRKFPKTDSFL
ncbi:unnamed protein product, partial [Mesorhabditis spiculigera]